MIEETRKLSLDDLRAAYKKYLAEENFSANTIATSASDAFYIWRKQDADTFWEIILSDKFETVGKNTLLDLLRQHSSGNAESNMSAYMAQLRRFRLFLQSDPSIEIQAAGPRHYETRKNPQKKIKQILPTPSVDEVDAYLAKWNTLEDYHLQEVALNKLFFDLCPDNKDLSEILLKVSVLNDFYSTNIFKVFPVAKRILELQVDDRLQRGDRTLVEDIQEVEISGKKNNFYSFATKYCSHHKPLDFPIYDSYVDEVLRYFRNVDGFTNFSNCDLRNYPRFKSILEEFRKFYHLDKYNLKQLDMYIWQLGKEYFNKFV